MSVMMYVIALNKYNISDIIREFSLAIDYRQVIVNLLLKI